MEQLKKQWLLRAFIGALAGMAFFVLLGCAIGGIGYFNLSGFRYVSCRFYVHNEPLGLLLSLALFALFGAEVGLATLPFADSGRELVVSSLAHFTVMAATVSVWAVMNLGAVNLPFFLVPLALVYALVWLGRWVGWYAEVASIREKLGLAPGPSLFHWKETLPYLGFALLMCDVLPLALRPFDNFGIPVLVGLLLPYLLLPAGAFASGLSLGRRHGFCPLYPLACGLFYVPIVFLLMNSSALFHCFMVAVPALAGNLAGAARHKIKTKRGGENHEKTDSSL